MGDDIDFETMNRSSVHPSPAVRLFGRVAILVLALSASYHAVAQRADSNVVPIWPGMDTATVVREAMPSRILSDNEVWNASVPRFVEIDPGSSNRNILLPALSGANGVPGGTVIVARVLMPAGNRIMLRDADGALMGMINGSESASVQWATLTARTDRWDVRISPTRETATTDPIFIWGGARPVVAPSGVDGDIARPANPRTSGYSLRFESDSPVVVLNCAAERVRLRVIVDGIVIAVVDVPERSRASGIGVRLGDSRRRRIELLIDEGALRSIEVPDVQHGLYAWQNASPQVRMLVLGDDTGNAGARTFAWAAASRLGFECWSLAWGDGGARLGASGPGLVPEELIAEDIAGAAADLIVVSGGIMNGPSDNDEYGDHLGRWLDSISRAARPEAVKILLPPFPAEGGDRRLRVIERAARQRGFLFLNWRGWLGADAGGLVDFGGQLPSDAGHIVLGGRLVEEFAKLDITAKARQALLVRTALSGSK